MPITDIRAQYPHLLPFYALGQAFAVVQRCYACVLEGVGGEGTPEGCGGCFEGEWGGGGRCVGIGEAERDLGGGGGGEIEGVFKPVGECVRLREREADLFAAGPRAPFRYERGFNI